MGHADRPTIIAGNWKMYKTIGETVAYIHQFIPLVKDVAPLVYLAVPFTAIRAASDAAKGTNIVIGAQDVNEHAEGAFTGEISCGMLKEAGAQFVIVGHSERRQIYHESDAMVNKKLRAVYASGLQPILCVGETLQMREAGVTEFVLQTQVTHSLDGFSSGQVARTIIAYEPVWAIGTNKHATPEIAEKAHRFIREVISETWDAETAARVVIQYGGSVKPENAPKLLLEPDIDGLLVGGASLSAVTFSQIIKG
jgi:triosephosphate isomerase (TIM)